MLLLSDLHTNRMGRNASETPKDTRNQARGWTPQSNTETLMPAGNRATKEGKDASHHTELRRPVQLPGDPPRLRPRQTTSSRGRRFPADPPRVEEIVAVIRAAGPRPTGLRLRGLIAVLWRAGLRINEALTMAESDLEPARGSLLVRHGKGERRREVGMDEWGWEQLRPWLALRVSLPVGPLFCVLKGPTQGRPWSANAVREQMHRIAARAEVRRRFAPHQLRHAHAVEMAREGVPLNVIQRQLGHANLGITSIYLQGIDSAEIINAVHSRKAPVVPASAMGL